MSHSVNEPNSASLHKVGVANLPEMVIISDTVYASFVEEFNTFGKDLPENILGAYSYSKFFREVCRRLVSWLPAAIAGALKLIFI